MPIPVSLAPTNPSAPQPATFPPTLARSASSYTTPSGAGPSYPSSAGVSFAGAHPNPHVASGSQRPPPSPSSYAGATYPVSRKSSYGGPAPGPMPLSAVREGGYEYDTESTDSESVGAGWKGGPSSPAASPHPSLQAKRQPDSQCRPTTLQPPAPPRAPSTASRAPSPQARSRTTRSHGTCRRTSATRVLRLGTQLSLALRRPRLRQMQPPGGWGIAWAHDQRARTVCGCGRCGSRGIG
ncbi:hypothetical protein DFH09DRAFT_477107 [Mycena vulgaris]|nr:hypothetical protein DFH09DRAFT_477107 [Mycena vulgaris]